MEYPYNLDDPDSRQTFTNEVKQWIADASVPHKTQLTEWNDVESRLNGSYTVGNFDNSSSTTHAQNANAPTANPDDVQPQWIKVPRSRPNHEAVLGQFVNQNRSLTVSPRTPRDKAIAKIIKERIKYIEDTNDLKNSVYFPLIDGAWSKGLHWIHVRYDASRKGIKKYEISDVSARDVLVDPRSRGKNFQTSRYRILRFSKYYEEAKQEFKDYPYFDADAAIRGNKDYDIAYEYDSQDIRQQIVFYLVEFWKPSVYYMWFNPKNRKEEELTKEQYDQLSKDPNLLPFIFEIQGDPCFYYALYEEGNGVFYFDKSELGDFGLIPLQNFYTEQRLYPYGDVKMYQPLEDLLSMLVTLLNENIKRSNYPIATGDMQAWERYSKEIQSALDRGGFAPGIAQIHFPQQVHQGIVMLINYVMGWIQDSAALHSASMGELPAKQVAKETVKALMAKDRQSHGRKDIMLDSTLTQLAKVLVRAISVLDTDEDFIPITDPKSSFQYLPVNKILTESEYKDMLIEIAGISKPQTPEEIGRVEERLVKLRKEFEDQNDVKIVPTIGIVDEGGMEYTNETVLEMAQEYQQTDEPDMAKFFAEFPMQQKQIKLYYINMLTPDVDLNVRYGIASDLSADPEYKINLAYTLREQGAISRVDFLEDLGIIDARERIERADAENQALALAKQLNDNPQMMQQIMQILEAMKQQPVQKNGVMVN